MASKRVKKSGKEKKVERQRYKEFSYGSRFRKEGLKESSKYRPGGKKYKGLEGKLNDLAEGYEKYGSKEKDPYKRLKEFGLGGKAYSALELENVNKQFDPIRKQALQNYDQFTQPEIANRYGAGNAGSSAFNQALTAGRGNLEADLNARLADLAVKERARQQTMQLGVEGSMFSSKQGADFAQLQNLQQIQQYLTGVGLGEAHSLQGAGMNQGQYFQGQPAYLTGPKQNSNLQEILGAATEAAAYAFSGESGKALQKKSNELWGITNKTE